jgi:hypothetical protein
MRYMPFIYSMESHPVRSDRMLDTPNMYMWYLVVLALRVPGAAAMGYSVEGG